MRLEGALIRRGRLLEVSSCDRVVVVSRSWGKKRAVCTCGWRDRSRLLAASAKVDALVHAAAGRCEPGVPLTGWELVDDPAVDAHDDLAGG
jgi:hypothetical protein